MEIAEQRQPPESGCETHFTRLNRTSNGLFRCCSKDPFSSWNRDKEYTLAESANTLFFRSQAPLLFKASSYVDIL